MQEYLKNDRLFIVELLNDLHRYGFHEGGKAATMLHDWARELKKETQGTLPSSQFRRLYKQENRDRTW